MATVKNFILIWNEELGKSEMFLGDEDHLDLSFKNLTREKLDTGWTFGGGEFHVGTDEYFGVGPTGGPDICVMEGRHLDYYPERKGVHYGEMAKKI